MAKVFNLLEVGERGCNPSVRTFKNLIAAELAWLQNMQKRDLCTCECDLTEEDVYAAKDGHGLEPFYDAMRGDGEFGNFWTDEGEIVCIVESKLE